MSEPAASDRPTPTSPSGRAWPHVRALLVALHIVAVLLLAIPDAGGVALERASWKNPTVQAELSAWAERLSTLGYHTDTATLEGDVYAVAKSWTGTLKALRVPVRPYSDYLGVRQTWRMFVAPHRHPATLHVDIEEDGQWRPIHVARSDEYDWRRGQLDHPRMRSMLFRYGWKRYDRYYRGLTRWLATQAAGDFPQATRVRIRMYGFRTPTPEEVRADAIPEGKFKQQRVFAAEDLR
ncbi:MAG: hypothetical protein AAF799_35500 [Myxococcota bacterium]